MESCLNGALADDGGCPNALVVTRSQHAAMKKAETERMDKEAASGAKPSPVENETESDPCEDGVDSSLNIKSVLFVLMIGLVISSCTV